MRIANIYMSNVGHGVMWSLDVCDVDHIHQMYAADCDILVITHLGNIFI